MDAFARLNPNILLTEKCNLSCSCCFAKNKMDTTEKKEMNLLDFKKVLNILEINKQKEIRLMGGEPTLHSQFKEFIDLILSRGLKIKLFTNGFFSEELAYWMANKGSSVKYTLNLTAVVSTSESEKEIVERNLKILKKSSIIYGNIIIDSAEFNNIPLVNFIKSNEIKFIRIGIANNMISNCLDTISIQYKDTIVVIMRLINELRQAEVSHISLNCGFTPCMFQTQQKEQLAKEHVEIRGWSCQGKLGAFDIATNLSIFPCFMTEDLKINNISVFSSLNSAKTFLKKSSQCLFNFSSLAIVSSCKKCYHFQKLECTGPCIGYIKNNAENSKILKEFRNSFLFKTNEKLLYIFRNWL